MKFIGYMFLLIACCLVLNGCTASSTANNTTANAANTANTAPANAAAKPAAPAATLDALVALEKTGWESWKTKDPKPLESLMSDRAVAFGANGREDKAANIKSVTDPKCVVNSYSFSDEKLTNLGPDVAVLTFKAAQDYACDGKKGPANVYSASVYVREGDKWKNLTYLESPVIDPKNPPKFTAPAGTPKPDASTDALTTELMAVEKKAWDAWKSRDRKAMEAVITSSFATTGMQGYMDRDSILKYWSEPKCQGLDYTFADAKGMQVTPDVTLVTYRADMKGSCDGAAVPPSVWVASFDMKEGGEWKNAFYVDRPRQ